jgi:hypothetical protein
MKPSSNGYAYDGPPFDGGSADIIGKLEIKEDGCIVCRSPTCSAELATMLEMSIVWSSAKRLRTMRSQRGACTWNFATAIAMHCQSRWHFAVGITVALEVVAVRRDGFDGDIELVMEGLPEGVTAQGLKIPKGKTRGIMLLTADQNAPRSLANVTFYGKSRWTEQNSSDPCTWQPCMADSWIRGVKSQVLDL